MANGHRPATQGPRQGRSSQDGHPKPVIAGLAEDLLATFKTAPILDAYRRLSAPDELPGGDPCRTIAASSPMRGGRWARNRVKSSRSKTKRTNSSGPRVKTQGQAICASNSILRTWSRLFASGAVLLGVVPLSRVLVLLFTGCFPAGQKVFHSGEARGFSARIDSLTNIFRG